MTSLGGYDPFLPVDSGWFGMQIVFSPDAISWEHTTSGTRESSPPVFCRLAGVRVSPGVMAE